MDRNVGQKNQWVLRKLLQKQFEEASAKIGGIFTYNFTKEKPYFELTLRVKEEDFTNLVKDAELSDLKVKVRELEDKLVAAETIREDIVTINGTVLAHQKRGSFHRLVVCGELPQLTSVWKPMDETCHIQGYRATWNYVDG